MDIRAKLEAAFLKWIAVLATVKPHLATRFLSKFMTDRRGMAPVISLFLGLATVIIIALVSVLLSGVVSGQMDTLFTNFNVSSTWSTIADNLESIISSSYSIGGLGILLFAFMVILSILGVGMATRR